MNQDILSNIIITRIVSISTLYNDEGISRTRHNRQLWAIIVKYEGESQYICNGKKYLSNINNTSKGMLIHLDLFKGGALFGY